MTKYLLVLSVVILLAGCAHKPSIVGKWQGNQSTQFALIIEFKSDGTQINSVSSPLGQIVETGTYQADGKRLTETLGRVTVNGIPVPLSASHPPGAGDGTYTLESDTLTITEDNQAASGKSYTLHRMP